MCPTRAFNFTLTLAALLIAGDQIQRQVDAVGGDASKIRWEISTDLGAKGISELIKDYDLPPIEVKWVVQKTEVY